MKRSPLLLIGLISLSFGCKTTEDIRRDQMVDNLSLQMVQSQQMTAEATIRLQAMEERLGLLTGQVEEQEYQTIQETSRKLDTLKERLEVIESNNRNQQRELEGIKRQLDEQKKFMDELMKTLNSLSEARKRNNPANIYEEAMQDYQRGRYAAAKGKLERLLNQNQVQGNQRSRTLHNLGMIAWMDTNDQQAQVYFSRLITEHPDAPQVRNGMLFLGKSFKRSGQRTEARQILEELIRQYPDANQVSEARKALAGL